MGRLAEIAGGRDVELDLPAAVRDVPAVREWLARERPQLAEALGDPAVRILVNATLAAGAAAVGPGDEIAFLPIMSGG